VITPSGLLRRVVEFKTKGFPGHIFDGSLVLAEVRSDRAALGATDLRGNQKLVSNILSVRAVLQRSAETHRDGHGQHAEQKATEDLQSRMAGCAGVPQIPDREEQYRRNKETDHVSADLRSSVETHRDVHGQHAGQKATEDMQSRIAGGAAAPEIPDREEQYPRDKDTDHVSAKP
jgi:hypothetical protein